MESKLTVSELKNYLGTGLKCLDPKNDSDYRADSEIPVQFEVYGLTDEYAMIDCSVLQTDCDFADIRPICYRLQDLDKFIEELGFVPIDIIGDSDNDFCDIDFSEDFGIGNFWEYLNEFMTPTWNKHHIHFMPYGFIQKLFQWHFWPFDQSYFEKGLIIDKLKHDGK